jgi:hypothetical protein
LGGASFDEQAPPRRPSATHEARQKSARRIMGEVSRRPLAISRRFLTLATQKRIGPRRGRPRLGWALRLGRPLSRLPRFAALLRLPRLLHWPRVPRETTCFREGRKRTFVGRSRAESVPLEGRAPGLLVERFLEIPARRLTGRLVALWLGLGGARRRYRRPRARRARGPNGKGPDDARRPRHPAGTRTESATGDHHHPVSTAPARGVKTRAFRPPPPARARHTRQRPGGRSLPSGPPPRAPPARSGERAIAGWQSPPRPPW